MSDKYIPTPSEQKLIAALINPENLGKSITDLCNLADVSRNFYYEAIKKPDFIDYLNKITIEVLKSKVNDVINATFRYATTEKRNSQDRITLLKMAGIFKEEQNINIKSNTIEGKSIENMTDEELQSYIDSKQNKDQ